MPTFLLGNKLSAPWFAHEAFHLRHWRFRRHEGKVECQALGNFRDATRRLGATAAQAEDIYPYALALHAYKVRLFSQYKDPTCVIPPWARRRRPADRPPPGASTTSFQ